MQLDFLFFFFSINNISALLRKGGAVLRLAYWLAASKEKLVRLRRDRDAPPCLKPAAADWDPMDTVNDCSFCRCTCVKAQNVHGSMQ